MITITIMITIKERGLHCYWALRAILYGARFCWMDPIVGSCTRGAWGEFRRMELAW